MAQFHSPETYNTSYDDNKDLVLGHHNQNQDHAPATFRVPRKAVPNTDTESDFATLIGHSPSIVHQPARNKNHGSRLKVLRWWIPELIASIVSVASLIGIAIFLHAYDGQSINAIQLPYSLSINGVLALLATINRVVLMIPISSGISQEVWLWFATHGNGKSRSRRIKDIGRSDNASRGAWGSLMFMFFYPGRWLACMGAFVTIISLAFGTFTQQLIAISQSPAILNGTSIVGNIPRGESWDFYAGPDPAETFPSLPLDVKASLYNGILSSSVDPIRTDCPTGNCTWPITPSLAVCGQCTPTNFKTNCTANPLAVVCGFTTASGTVIDLMGISEEGGVAFGVEQYSNINDPDTWYITRFDMLGVPYNSSGYDYPGLPVTASSCALWFCVNAYDIKVQNSNQFQRVTETFHKYETATFEAGAGLKFQPLPITMNPIPGLVYGMNDEQSSSFINTLHQLLAGNVTLQDEANYPSSDIVAATWQNSGDPDPWIKRIALSLTNSVRGHTVAQHNLYNGIAYETVIAIHWYWIVLPGAMVILSLVFLALVMIKTAKSSVSSWKGSPLAYLIFSVDTSIREAAIGRTDHFNALEDAIGHRRVVLDAEAGGFRRFRGV